MNEQPSQNNEFINFLWSHFNTDFKIPTNVDIKLVYKSQSKLKNPMYMNMNNKKNT